MNIIPNCFTLCHLESHNEQCNEQMNMSIVFRCENHFVLHLLENSAGKTTALYKDWIHVMKNILFKLQLVILKSILSENVMGGEGIGGVMWFVR